jgi:hypothetical protein
VDVKRAADLYAQGWTLRQIRAELHLSTVNERLQSVWHHMRSAGAVPNLSSYVTLLPSLLIFVQPKASDSDAETI